MTLWRHIILATWVFYVLNAAGEPNQGLLKIDGFKNEADCNVLRNWRIDAYFKDTAPDPKAIARYASPCISQQTVVVEQ
jgi:hypothetical protein